ncbi:MAG TPA: DUF6682 family protein [Nevskiaceae bacterium]|nr:DUF6682 family protein [Nevskiaceae bacterium]
MATITGDTILTRASKTLLDETNVYWATAELLDYLASGITDIVAHKPDAYVQRKTLTLAAGVTQEIPADGVQFLDAYTNGNGDAVWQIARNLLDHSNQQWRSQTPSANVTHYMADKRDPKHFMVYPPATTTATLEILYAAVPARYTDSTAVIPIDDLYDAPLHNWVVAYALAKNSSRGDLNKASAYLTLYYNAINARSQVQFAFAPLVADEAQGSDARSPTALSDSQDG